MSKLCPNTHSLKNNSTEIFKKRNDNDSSILLTLALACDLGQHFNQAVQKWLNWTKFEPPSLSIATPKAE
jgi:hypothetical protein